MPILLYVASNKRTEHGYIRVALLMKLPHQVQNDYVMLETLKVETPPHISQGLGIKVFLDFPLNLKLKQIVGVCEIGYANCSQ